MIISKRRKCILLSLLIASTLSSDVFAETIVRTERTHKHASVVQDNPQNTGLSVLGKQPPLLNHPPKILLIIQPSPQEMILLQRKILKVQHLILMQILGLHRQQKTL